MALNQGLQESGPIKAFAMKRCAPWVTEYWNRFRSTLPDQFAKGKLAPYLTGIADDTFDSIPGLGR
jgi:hypothetical protein